MLSKFKKFVDNSILGDCSKTRPPLTQIRHQAFILFSTHVFARNEARNRKSQSEPRVDIRNAFSRELISLPAQKSFCTRKEAFAHSHNTLPSLAASPPTKMTELLFGNKRRKRVCAGAPKSAGKMNRRPTLLQSILLFEHFSRDRGLKPAGRVRCSVRLQG